jgi:hypothetical protein
MRKEIILLAMILFLLASCERNAEPVHSDYAEEAPHIIESADLLPQEDAIPTEEIESSAPIPLPAQDDRADPWRTAYAELLRGYEDAGYVARFFLHDMTGSGIPEIFIEATHPGDYRGDNCFISLYTFSFGEVHRLEICEDFNFLNAIRSARTGLFAAPANAPGLVRSLNGAGSVFGASVFFWRLGIVQGVLTVEAHGIEDVDICTLREMFPCGGGSVDSNELIAAMLENTHYILHDEIVTDEYFAHVFGLEETPDGFFMPHDREILRHNLTDETLREVISAWQPEKVIFRTTQRVHVDMPEFTFYRIVGDHLSGESDYEFAGIERYATIIIKDENGNLIQKIDGIAQGGHSSWSLAVDDDTFGIRFADFNFDGYLDMWVHTAINPGSAGGAWARYWLWNAETGQFEENAQLSAIHNMSYLSVDEDSQQVLDRFRFSGEHWQTRVFEYINGEFVVVDVIDCRRN